MSSRHNATLPPAPTRRSRPARSSASRQSDNVLPAESSPSRSLDLSEAQSEETTERPAGSGSAFLSTQLGDAPLVGNLPIIRPSSHITPKTSELQALRHSTRQPSTSTNSPGRFQFQPESDAASDSESDSASDSGSSHGQPAHARPSDTAAGDEANSPTSQASVTSDLELPVVDSLQSPQHRRLLDLVDELRTHGISDFASLPQLIVCGDQSCGKSSVLEAITEVPFPRRDSLCTRFATQIVLRRSAVTKAAVKIIPDATSSRRSPSNDPDDVLSFARDIDDLAELPRIMDEAATAMGIGQSGFSAHVLSVEVSGPTRPQLTVVDLPGLIHTASRTQTEADVQLVSDLVDRYMNDDRTIILAIVSGKNDIANQVVLSRAHLIDPEGHRTMGIVTKPDTLPRNSPSEAEFFRLATNTSIKFRLGWHVVRNRTYEERECSFQERQEMEDAFFNQGIWRTLAKENVGITALRARLSKVLLDHIVKELPRVIQEIDNGLLECREGIQRLGERRITADEQRRYLSTIITELQRVCKDAVDGNYEHPFFAETPDETLDRTRRLRWAVQEMNEQFAREMRIRGHTKQISETGHSNFRSPSNPNDPHIISRKEALAWIGAVRRRSRGRELPGTFNPLLIGPLFTEQSEKWSTIASSHLSAVWGACDQFLQSLLPEFVSSRVSQSLYDVWVAPSLELCSKDALKEFEALCRDRKRSPITYDSHVRRIKSGAEQRWRERLQSAFSQHGQATNGTLALEFIENFTLEIDKEANEQALDHLLAYYDGARRTFVDNVAIQVVERHLIDGLPEIFRPVVVHDMSEDMLALIAAELPEEQRLRTALEEKQETLRQAKQIIRLLR